MLQKCGLSLLLVPMGPEFLCIQQSWQVQLLARQSQAMSFCAGSCTHYSGVYRNVCRKKISAFIMEFQLTSNHTVCEHTCFKDLNFFSNLSMSSHECSLLKVQSNKIDGSYSILLWDSFRYALLSPHGKQDMRSSCNSQDFSFWFAQHACTEIKNNWLCSTCNLHVMHVI